MPRSNPIPRPLPRGEVPESDGNRHAEMAPHGVNAAALMIGRTRTPALERTELHENTGVPTAEPDDVVAYALAHLGDGPVLVPPEHQKSFEAMRAMPRRKAVEIMTRSLEPQTKDLM